LAYMSLHFGATTLAVRWVYRERRHAFPLVRMTLIISTAVALVAYVLYPAAPPRLAGVGISDTVSKHTGVNLSSDLLGSFYNPFAALPPLHFGYALARLRSCARRSRGSRAAGGCACAARCTPPSCSSTSSPRGTTSGSTRR